MFACVIDPFINATAFFFFSRLSVSSLISKGPTKPSPPGAGRSQRPCLGEDVRLRPLLAGFQVPRSAPFGLPVLPVYPAHVRGTRLLLPRIA